MGSGGGVGYSASSSASSGVNATNAFDSSGWVVNYGTQSSIPVWAWVAAAAVAALFILKRGH